MKHIDFGALPFIEASNYTPANRLTVDLVVIHSTEGLEKSGSARNVATWFAGDDAPQASAHYVVDPDTIVRCVPDESVAWAAPGANRNGLHIELCGRAGQTLEQWHDEDSAAILDNAIELTTMLCRKWSIPAMLCKLPIVGARGITTHAFVTKAYPKLGNHWDPGPSFPLEWFCGRVAGRLNE